MARARKPWHNLPEGRHPDMVRPPELLYAVDEAPPPAVLVVSAIQHVAVIAITLYFFP